MKQLLTLIFTVLFYSQMYAQQENTTDTIELARSNAYAQRFKEADRLLTLFTSSKNDLNAFRLHAQVLYWMKEFKRSAVVLEQALSAFPGEVVLNLEYGRLLYNTGAINQSEIYLLKYHQSDSLHIETNLMLAHIWFWQGRFKESIAITEEILQMHPSQKEAINLLNEINYTRAIYIKLNGSVLSDDQPLSSQLAVVETGAYRSSAFAPKLKLIAQNFNADQQSYSNWWLQVGNTFSSGKNGLSLSFMGGVFQSAGNTNTIFTGEAVLSKKFGRYVTADATIAHKPYQFTIAAAKNPIMQTLYGGSLQFNQKDKWVGKAAYELQQFADQNKIYTAYAWLSVPLVHQTKFWLNTGYSIAWQTSAFNTSTYKKPLPSLAVIYNTGLQIQTVYDPYFTPLNQIVNSLLLSTKIFFSPKAAINLRGSVGFLAQADIPYYYVQYNPPQYKLYQGFASQPYHPFEFFAALELHPVKHFHLQFNYQYNSLLFYKLSTGSIQLNYHFYHERK